MLMGLDQLAKERLMEKLSLSKASGLACLSVGVGGCSEPDRSPDLMKGGDASDSLVRYLGRILECARLKGETDMCTIRCVSLPELECWLGPLYYTSRIEKSSHRAFATLCKNLKPLLPGGKDFYIFLDGSPPMQDAPDPDGFRAFIGWLRDEFSKIHFGCPIDGTLPLEEICQNVLELVAKVSKGLVEEKDSEGSPSDIFSSDSGSDENPSPPLSPLLREETDLPPKKRARQE